MENNEPAIMMPNKYGFKLNIQHPKINALYERYKSKAEKAAYGLSDSQRIDFENKVIAFYSRLYKKRYKHVFTYPGLDYQRKLINEMIDKIDLPIKMSERT